MNIYHDPIWEIMDAMTSYPFNAGKLANTGLKSTIKRPHNLVEVKDDDGNVVAQRLEVVTTPFKKEDVKVTILDNVLSVNCGSENIQDKEEEDYIYRGISSQSYQFSLKLAPSVDIAGITAENKDGVLKVTLPRKVEEKKESEAIEIKIA